jgi:O-antigen/teichoic acid export membrane protein
LEILRFGSALQLTRFLAFTSARLHVTLLAALAGVDSVAFFAVAARIPDALKTLSDSYFRVYFPTMTSLLATDRPRATALFERTLRLGSFAGALGAVISVVFSREIVALLFSSKYVASAPVFGLLMVALQMSVMLNVVGTTLIAAGRPGRILVMDVAWAAVSAIGDLLLIPGLGIVGSGLTAVGAGYLSSPLAMWLARRSKFHVPFGPYVIQSLIMVLCAALGWWVQPVGLVATLAFKASIIATFVVLSVRLSTISLDDVALVVGERLRRQTRQMVTGTAPDGLRGITRGNR